MIKMKNPAAGAQQGSSNVASQADSRELIKSFFPIQHNLAAERIARRFALTLPVARVTAELAGIGGVNG